MKYKIFINENLLNSFMSRREMVQIMLQDLNPEEKELICKKLKETSFGTTLPEDNLSEQDFFSTIAYYYLAKEQDAQLEKMFLLYANDYLNTYKTFEDVLRHLRMKN